MKLNFFANKSSRVIFAIILALAIALATLAAVNRNSLTGVVSDGSLTLSAGDTPLKTYSYEEIKNYPVVVSIEKEIKSSKGEDEQGVFTGIPLEALLNEASPAWRDSYTEFLFHTADGFAASVFLSDIEKGENVIVAFQKDGAFLPGPDAGGKGPLRIVIADDPFGNRSAYLLTRIELL